MSVTAEAAVPDSRLSDDESRPGPIDSPAGGFFRQLIDGSKDWRQLARTPYGTKPALIMGAIGFFQVFDTTAFALAGPEIIREFKIDVSSIIRIQQVIGFFALFAALYIGWVADRVRRVPIYVVGTAISGIASASSALATSVLTLGIPRTIDDVADQASSVPAGSLLADYYPPEARGRVFSVLGISANAARLLALPAAGGAITLLGLRRAWVLFAIPLVVMSVIAHFTLKEPVRGYFERKAMGAPEEVALQREPPQSFGEGWRTTWSVRTIRRLFFASMVSGLGSGVYFFLGLFLAEKYRLNAFERGLIGLPGALGAMAGGYFGGGLVDVLAKGRPERVLTVFGGFSAVSALSVAVIALGPPLPILAASTLLFGFGGALLGPALGAVTSQVVPPTIRSQGLQVFGLASLPMLLFGLPLYGAVFARFGYMTTFLVSMPFFLVGAAVMASSAKFFSLDRRNATAAAMASAEWRRTQASGQGKLLVCRDLEVGYAGVQVLFGIDFDVEEGEIIALLGTNGAGKSTLLRAICGLQEATSGAIVHDGRDITHMPTSEIAHRGVVLMPGGRGVFPALSVRENLILGAWMVDDEAERERRLRETYDLFPVLREREHLAAGKLSGGEQQQLSLAQAMVSEPKLLMIDELSLGLSPRVVGELMAKVREIHRRGTTIIIVEQSVNVALEMADKAIFLEKGEVRFVGATAELQRRPDILRAVYVRGVGGGGSIRDDRRREHELLGAAAALEVRGIGKSFGGVVALDSVDLVVPQGSVVGLIGPNGSGKTTLLDIISGFQSPDAGAVLLDGHDVTTLSPSQRAQRKLVRRFQDARMFPSLTLFETLLISLDHRLESRTLLSGSLGSPRSRAAERRLRLRAESLIEMLDLGDYREKFVKELSTGLRRIVDIACVVAVDPDVLLLDEPSSGIAQAEAESLAPLLRRIRHETSCSILIIEHDMSLLTRVADQLVALAEGRVLTSGAPKEVLGHELVIESYLGNDRSAINRSGLTSGDAQPKENL